MAASGVEFFTMNEVNRLKVIQAVIEKRLRSCDAASQLDLTERQVQRMMNRYRESGAAGLTNAWRVLWIDTSHQRQGIGDALVEK